MPRSIRSERLGIFRTGITVAHGPQPGRSTILALPAALLLLSLLPEHTNDIVESLFDIDAVLGRRFDKITTQVLGQCLTLLSGYGALDGLVALVTHQHHRHRQRGTGGSTDGGCQVTGTRGRTGVGGFLDHLDLIVEFLYPRKRGPRSDAVDENEAFTIPDPLVA